MSSRKGKQSAKPPKPKPWSHREGQPFKLAPNLDPRNFSRRTRHTIPSYKERKSLTKWSDIHSVFYNGMLNVEIEPTRTLDMEILREMGIDVSVQQLIKDMGFGTMAYADYDLYPDLVRQFLATCEVEETSNSCFRNLYFFCNGVRHSILVEEIADIYGWEILRVNRTYDAETLKKMEPFWEAIGYGDFDTVELKISRIANPTFRIVAKVLAHTYFCRQEPDRICKSALALMYTGLSREIRSMLTSGTPPRVAMIDLQLMFADMLAERKYRALGVPSGPRIDFIGSLITPILKDAGVDLSRATVITHRPLIDRAYLANARIFRNGIYHWTTKRGADCYCLLPRPDWTDVDTLEKLRFAVPGPEQCTAAGSVLPAFESIPEPLQVIYDSQPDRLCRHGNPFPDPTPLATDFAHAFYESIPPLPAGASMIDWQAHHQQMQGQQTTILRGIMGALSHVTWNPPPACCSSPPDHADEHHE